MKIYVMKKFIVFFSYLYCIVTQENCECEERYKTAKYKKATALYCIIYNYDIREVEDLKF